MLLNPVNLKPENYQLFTYVYPCMNVCKIKKPCPAVYNCKTRLSIIKSSYFSPRRFNNGSSEGS